VDYKQIYSPENIKKIQKLVTKLEENIVNLKIKNIVYYVIEREVHIENESNILLFSLEDDINTQIEKTAIFHKQHFSLNTNGLYYIDMRVPNKIFYCTRKEQNTCEKHLKRIYES
jgi:K+ transporter